MDCIITCGEAPVSDNDEGAYCDVTVKDGIVVLIFGVVGKGARKYELDPMAAIKLADILSRAAWDAIESETEE